MTLSDILSTTKDADTGYIVVCDLDYPQEIHDLHNDLPLAVENRTIDSDRHSGYTKFLAETLNYKEAKVTKLVGTLDDKKNYTLHYRNLQQYVELGMIVRKVHKVIAFTQRDFLRPYIEMNTGFRQQAGTDFEKDFFKLMNNAVFGKTMQNKRRFCDVKLDTETTKHTKLVSNPRLMRTAILSSKFNNEGVDFTAVQLVKRRILLDQPVYLGLSILDLSKTLMYDFHYNVIKEKYGDRAKLLFTDTDSLAYEITGTADTDGKPEEFDLYNDIAVSTSTRRNGFLSSELVPLRSYFPRLCIIIGIVSVCVHCRLHD